VCCGVGLPASNAQRTRRGSSWLWLWCAQARTRDHLVDDNVRYRLSEMLIPFCISIFSDMYLHLDGVGCVRVRRRVGTNRHNGKVGARLVGHAARVIPDNVKVVDARDPCGADIGVVYGVRRQHAPEINHLFGVGSRV